MQYQNPFLRGMLGAQHAAQSGTAQNIQNLGGLLSLQNSMEMAPIQREMAQLQLQQARQGPQPKWQVSERFNPQTGQKEKVLVDLNNPQNVQPFGGQESRPLSFQNVGNAVVGLDPLTGQPRSQPQPIGASPNTLATLAQGQQQFNATLPIQAANAGVNIANLGYNTGMGPAPIPGFTPPQMGPQGAPSPQPQATPGGMQIPPAVQAQRDAEAARIRAREVTGGGIPTASVVQGSQPPQPQTFVPPGTTMGGGQPRPTLPPRLAAEQAVKTAEKNADLEKTVKTYVAARDGLITGLSGTETGPFVGRIPAVTEGQQVGEGAVAAMAPVLKQIFRVAGEGIFTDRDQELLLAMVPTRADHPAARKAKLENIDRIISAKLGMPIPKIPDSGLEFNGFRFPSQDALNAYKKAAGIP